MDSISTDPSGASSLGFVSSDLKFVQFLVLAATCLKCVFRVSAVPLELNVGLSFIVKRLCPATVTVLLSFVFA